MVTEDAPTSEDFKTKSLESTTDHPEEDFCQSRDREWEDQFEDTILTDTKTRRKHCPAEQQTIPMILRKAEKEHFTSSKSETSVTSLMIPGNSEKDGKLNLSFE